MADNKAKKAEQEKTPVNKEAKFKEIASKRVPKAMQAIRLIGNLASPNYSYTEEHAEKIISSLQAEIDTLYEKFKAKAGKVAVKFEL